MKRYRTLEQLQAYIAKQRNQAESRGVTYKKIDLGSGPAADYNNGSGSWTGD